MRWSLPVLALLLGACSPALNWREVPVAATGLVASFPCKPHENSAEVAMAGGAVLLAMRTCEADGATFAVGHAHLETPALVGPVLLQWRAAVLKGVQVRQQDSTPFQLTHASALPESVRLRVQGEGAAGRAVALQGAWFARGTDVFVAMVYAEALKPEATEPFFAGLRLQ